jgi:hypothetical protein
MWLNADLQEPPELVIEMTDQWLSWGSANRSNSSWRSALSRGTESSSRSYRKLPCEVTQSGNRRRMVLQQVAEFRPASLLEVGCGFRPVFTDLVHSPRRPAVSVRSRSKANDLQRADRRHRPKQGT